MSLFERHSRGAKPTTAGAAYVEEAREVLARLSQAEQDARLAASGATGRLSIGAVWPLTGGPIVGVLRAYSGAYPQVALRLVEDGNDELIARLRAGELEVVLVATDPPPLPRLKPINGLRDMALWLEPLCAAVPDTVEAEGLGWDDFAGKRLLSRPKDDWRRFTEYVSRLGGPVLSFAEQDVGMSSLLGLVAAGAGWSILPSCAAGLATAGVKIVPIVSAGASLQVEALWRPQTDNPALTRFLALLRQMYGAESPRLAADAAYRKRDPLP